MNSEQRAAQSGELCTCGRQATVVYISEKFGEVGYCGIQGSAAHPALPCPWCGASEPHRASWGDPAKCPNYQLRVPEPATSRDEGAPRDAG